MASVYVIESPTGADNHQHRGVQPRWDFRSGQFACFLELSEEHDGGRVHDRECGDGDQFRERRIDERNADGAAEHGGCFLPRLADEAGFRHGQGSGARVSTARGAATGRGSSSAVRRD